MARNKARIRVEAKWTGDSFSDRKKAFDYLFKQYKQRLDDSGLKKLWKEREFYESKASKRRRKDRASQLRREHEKLLERIAAGERVRVPAGLLRRKKNKNHEDE